jgi:hypothetical protein
VVLIAVRDHLELWRRDEFEAFEAGMWPEYPDQRAKAVDEMKSLAREQRTEANQPAS